MNKKIALHPRAVQARERAQQKKEEEAENYRKICEDAKWADNDKLTARKQARKNEKDEKRLNDIARKQAKKLLAKQEMDSLHEKSFDKQASRVTRKEISDSIAKTGPIGSSSGVVHSPKNSRRESSKTSPQDSDSDQEILPDVPLNLNRLQDDVLHAKGVDEAINLLDSLNFNGSEQAVDRHPEKRQRARFKEFREKELLRLNAEQPKLSFSQKEQIVFKTWQKSPDNPLYVSRFNPLT